MSAPYPTYGDDYEKFNLEFSNLPVVITRLLSCSDEGVALKRSNSLQKLSTLFKLYGVQPNLSFTK